MIQETGEPHSATHKTKFKNKLSGPPEFYLQNRTPRLTELFSRKMKIALLLLISSVVHLYGLDEETLTNTEISRQAEVHVFSVSAFKFGEIGRMPSAAELVAVKAFTLSVYNPYSAPAAVDSDELKKMGFQLLMTSKQEVSMVEGQKLACSQPLPWGKKLKSLEVLLKPVEGVVSVHAEVGHRDGVTPSKDNFVGLGSIGTHVFDDGLVVAWVAKPLATKK